MGPPCGVSHEHHVWRYGWWKKTSQMAKGKHLLPHSILMGQAQGALSLSLCSQFCLRCWYQDTASTTPSSASWPSSEVPPCTVSPSCRTTPPTQTLSSSLSVLHHPPLQATGSRSLRAQPLTHTPQEVLPSQTVRFNTQVSLWEMGPRWMIISVVVASSMSMVPLGLQGHLWAWAI